MGRRTHGVNYPLKMILSATYRFWFSVSRLSSIFYRQLSDRLSFDLIADN